MINPNTLQIGNLIKLSYGQIVKVVSTHEDFIDVQVEGVKELRRAPDSLSDLEITEERLREAGFVEYPTGRFRLDHFVIDERDHIYLGSTPLVRKGAWHDLQNLVRLISGKII